ncbi:hypothetical protein CU033_0612 [Enterococcus faecium]|nr:hypothetical protein [Enterococcus faecium]
MACASFVAVSPAESEMTKKVTISVESEDMDKTSLAFFLCLLYHTLECVLRNHFDLEE